MVKSRSRSWADFHCIFLMANSLIRIFGASADYTNPIETARLINAALDQVETSDNGSWEIRWSCLSAKMVNSTKIQGQTGQS